MKIEQYSEKNMKVQNFGLSNFSWLAFSQTVDGHAKWKSGSDEFQFQFQFQADSMGNGKNVIFVFFNNVHHCTCSNDSNDGVSP